MTNTTESRRRESAQIEALADAMRVHSTTDLCGDHCIKGRCGNIHVDGTGYSVAILATGARAWHNARRELSFARVTQDGDDEGCLHLSTLPTASQAEALRLEIGCKKIREYAPEVMDKLRQNARACLRPPATQAPLASH